MASITEIYNRTLTAIGSQTVGEPLQDSVRAQDLTAIFDQVRDAVLRAHPWNAALVRTSLPADATAPAWGFAAAYTRATDPYDLRVYRLEDPDTVYRIEGRKIVTDAGAPLNLVYIARIIDTQQWDPLLTQAVAARLAHAAVYKISSKATLVSTLWDQYRLVLAEARSIDGQEGTPEDIGADDFIRARY